MALKRLGQILTDLGLIDEEQLQEMLVEQEARGGELLGRVGVSLGFFSDEQLGEALAEQWNTSFCHACMTSRLPIAWSILLVRRWRRCIGLSHLCSKTTS